MSALPSTLVVYQFPGAFGLRSLSPFCTKLEAYLRLAGLPYRSRLGDPRQAPLGKLPYVRWTDGRLVGDSQAIIDRLEAEEGAPVDGHLDPGQRARGHLVRRLAEDHLYWVLLTVRWIDDRIWRDHYRAAIAQALPRAVQGFLPSLLRRRVRRALHVHGLGRHELGVVRAQARLDLAALVDVLGDRPFLLGERPSSFDCAPYAMVRHFLATPGDHPILDDIRQEPTLADWCTRLDARLRWEGAEDAASA